MEVLMTEMVSRVVRVIDEATRLGRLSNHFSNAVPPGGKRLRTTSSKSTGELETYEKQKDVNMLTNKKQNTHTHTHKQANYPGVTPTGNKQNKWHPKWHNR